MREKKTTRYSSYIYILNNRLDSRKCISVSVSSLMKLNIVGPKRHVQAIFFLFLFLLFNCKHDYMAPINHLLRSYYSLRLMG